MSAYHVRGAAKAKVKEDGTPMDAEMANPAISAFTKSLSMRWFKRLKTSPSFFAGFRPLFRLG
jgi:hypothetical protein